MSRRRTILRQIALLLCVVLLFVSFNGGLYLLLTRRLSNNFSGANQAKMIDVGRYLPFEEASDLARVETSLKLDGDLPVLDGAAALGITPVLIAANPASDVETNYTKIRDLRELIRPDETEECK